MIWAIVNRHYRGFTIKAVGFPVQHVGRVTVAPSLSVEKVQGEIVGSTLYAALTDFLRLKPDHRLEFSVDEIAEIRRLVGKHLDRRLRLMGQSFYRIAGLREAIRGVAGPGELGDMLGLLDVWITPKNFDEIRSGVLTPSDDDVERFLASLLAVADDFASATVNTDFIRSQLHAAAVDTTQERRP